MWNMQNDLQGGNAEGGSNNNNNIQNILRIQQQQQQQQQQGMQQGNMNIESLLQQQMGSSLPKEVLSKYRVAH